MYIFMSVMIHALSRCQVQLMSPVPTELNESSQLIEQSLLDEPSLPTSGCLAASHCGMVAGLHDNVQSRFTIVSDASDCIG